LKISHNNEAQFERLSVVYCLKPTNDLLTVTLTYFDFEIERDYYGFIVIY